MNRNFLSSALAALLMITLTAPLSYAQGGAPSEADETVLDDHLRLYWGNEVREIETLQKRRYRKESRWEFELYSGVIPNDGFFNYFPLGLRADYFFAEDFAAEVWGSYVFNSSTELQDFIESQFNQAFQVGDFQTLEWLAGANFLWSPIHGKIGLFTDLLSHFDFHLAFGVGAVGTKVRDKGRIQSKVDVAANVGAGLRFFLADQWSLRFDYRQFFYAAEGGGLKHPAELTLGISFFTKAPE